MPQLESDKPLYYPAVLGAGMAIGAVLGLISTPWNHGNWWFEIGTCGYIWGLIFLGVSSRWGLLVTIFCIFVLPYTGFSAAKLHISRTCMLGLLISSYLVVLWLRWRTLTPLRLLGAAAFTLALVMLPVIWDADGGPGQAGRVGCAWLLIFGLFLVIKIADSLSVPQPSRSAPGEPE